MEVIANFLHILGLKNILYYFFIEKKVESENFEAQW